MPLPSKRTAWVVNAEFLDHASGACLEAPWIILVRCKCAAGDCVGHQTVSLQSDN